MRMQKVRDMRELGRTVAETAQSLGLTERQVERDINDLWLVEPAPPQPPMTWPRWNGEEACSKPGVDPEWFFPIQNANISAQRDAELHSQAVRVCAACPQTGRCLQFAVANNILDGVWGGLTPRQRRLLRTANRTS